ncbi:hypothetical protein J5N97_000520 [Dioscorea zingiberensis]|uniref:Methionyl-tRNA synthetase anticodon-binding domain-containing protein n=1 Tax=Dioscorea zingiberensis TaxID=325984 RepID=A0A9D5H1I1_9LILI|nr:hypothetical protein J5N97_000520 [Dioscorea zingiberensis]
MLLLDTSPLLSVTLLITGRSGGRILRMSNCISLWARTMCHFTRSCFLQLLGTGENWTLMKNISVTEYLNYEEGKFSKSRGIGVFGNDAKGTGIPVEVWRYYLLTNRPEVSDTLFTWADLQAKLKKIVGRYVEQYIEAMEKVKLKQGLKIAMSISSEGNGYLQESKFWKLYKEDRPRCSIVIKTSVGLVHLLACLLEPYMPSFSARVLEQLNLPPESIKSLCDVNKAKRPWEIVPDGHKIGEPKTLFTTLNGEEVESLRKKFSGSQAFDREKRTQ